MQLKVQTSEIAVAVKLATFNSRRQLWIKTDVKQAGKKIWVICQQSNLIHLSHGTYNQVARITESKSNAMGKRGEKVSCT